jgi:1-acyl-sn-glycerol-3-phosphate acyltransferase
MAAVTAQGSNPKPSNTELPHPTNRNWSWLVIQYAMSLVFTFWLRYRARGVEKLPKTGGGLILINHQSFLDPLLVGLPLQRPVSYLARDSLFTIPLVGWVVRNTYVMPINRKSATTGMIKQAVNRLKHGFLVGIFPEGTRSTDGTIGLFKPGFIALIRRAKLPVYPAGIAGAYEALPRGSCFLYPRKIHVVFGEPFTQDELDVLTQRGNEERLVTLVRDRVEQCQAEAESWRRQCMRS